MTDKTPVDETPSTPVEAPAVPALRKVWVSCRREGCGSQEAEVLRSTRVPSGPIISGGGGSITYKCTKCGHAWGTSY